MHCCSTLGLRDGRSCCWLSCGVDSKKSWMWSQQPPPLSDYERTLVPLESEAGQTFAARLSDEGTSYLCLLLDSFEAQIEGSWCGLAVTAAALKVLKAWGDCEAFVALPTQQHLFEEALAVTRATKRALSSGMSLAEVEELVARRLRQHAMRAVVRLVDGGGDPTQLSLAFRDDLEAFGSGSSDANTPRRLLLVNLVRHVKGQSTGHWLLIAGSVRIADERWILLLDPAAHKLGNPPPLHTARSERIFVNCVCQSLVSIPAQISGAGPHWLPELLLISAMASLNFRHESRGYLAVETQSARGGAGVSDWTPLWTTMSAA